MAIELNGGIVALELQPTTTRPRVVVEDADPASARRTASALRTSGYDVELCGGPLRLQHKACPLVTDGRCQLLESSDAVLCRLWIENPRNRAVIEAIREHHPEIPLIVDVPPAPAATFAPVLGGCQTVFIRTDEDVVAAVTAVVPST